MSGPTDYPVDLVGRRPGATIRQPVHSPDQLDWAIDRLGSRAPDDVVWSIEPHRTPGAAVVESED